MNSPIATARIYTDFGGLAELKAGARRQSPEARKEVARQFEAMFLQMMLKSMRQAAEAAGTQESDQVKFYREMFDQQVALELAGGRGIGLARIFEGQLDGGGADRSLPLQMLGRRPFPAAPASSSIGVESVQDSGEGSDWPPPDPEQFLRRLWPAASRAAGRLGVAPEVILAQAALESGWGRRTPRSAEGESFNLFGIKADERWQGGAVVVPTVEYRDGVAVREQAAFRRYESPQQSIEDYAAFLQQNPRYRPALQQAAHPQRYLEALQRAGYATDPAYARKIGRILSGGVFAATVAELKSG